jgi:hypothetical protein
MTRPAPPLWTLALCTAVVLLVFSAGPRGDQSAGVASAATVAGLQDRLVNGLEVRRPVDMAFIAQVVTLVEQDRLPLSLILSTYKWARPKKPRPFPYFQRALRIRAAQIGVQL